MINEFVLKLDYVDFAVYSDIPENPKAIVCFLHGMGDHFARHSELLGRIKDAGFAVFGFDLMGHGKSPGIRGGIGSREEVFEQLEIVINHAKKECPGLPLFLGGHSMGGNIALAYRYIYPKADIKGYIILSPWLILRSAPSMLEHLKIRLLARFLPNVAIENSRGHRKTETDQPPRDVLTHVFITPKTYISRANDARLILENAGITAPPVFLTHGDADKLCSVEGSRQFAAMAGEMCKFTEYPGLFHETMHEPDWEIRTDEIINWINDNI